MAAVAIGREAPQSVPDDPFCRPAVRAIRPVFTGIGPRNPVPMPASGRKSTEKGESRSAFSLAMANIAKWACGEKDKMFVGIQNWFCLSVDCFERPVRKVIVELRHFAASKRPERIGGQYWDLCAAQKALKGRNISAQVVGLGMRYTLYFRPVRSAHKTPHYQYWF